MKGKNVMWERFSTSGLAGAYLDGLLADGVAARMEFRPRRALDPYPFLVRPADEGREPLPFRPLIPKTKEAAEAASV
jgi:hypothetical protein